MPEPLSLEDELVALGRDLVVGPPRDDLAAAVLAQLGLAEAPAATAAPAGPAGPESTPVGASAPSAPSAPSRRRPVPRRLGWAVAAAVVLVLALIPPVRAAVVELLHIGGVVVRQEPVPATPPVSASDTGSVTTPADPADRVTPVSLEHASQVVGGDLELPAALGSPTSVGIGHDGRVVEITWAATATAARGAMRLDVFVGSLSWGYLKTVWQAVTPVSVGGREGAWLGADHLVEWVDRRGDTHSEAPRRAGPTLVWVVTGSSGDLTYRLEGAPTLDRALEAARSAR